MVLSNMKKCTKCSIEKDENQFVKMRGDGFSDKCKSCREKINKSSRKCYEKKTKGNFKSPNTKRMTTHESINSISSDNSIDNGLDIDLDKKKKQVRRTTCNTHFTDLAIEQDYKCRGPPKGQHNNHYCPFIELGINILETDPDIDHIVPLSEGGLDESCNKQLLCPYCHKRKTTLETKRKYLTKMKNDDNELYKLLSKPKEEYLDF